VSRRKRGLDQEHAAAVLERPVMDHPLVLYARDGHANLSVPHRRRNRATLVERERQADGQKRSIDIYGSLP